MDKKNLIEFEKEIEKLYLESKIRAPIHLSGDNEEQIIEIFKEIKNDDWVFSNYRNHYHALLKGISPEWLREEIVKGHSMHIMNKKHKFYSSSIVAGQLPIALGTAMALKRKKSQNRVWAFCGDMAAETGVFYEVTKYAAGHNLPIKFIIEDNGLSVYTPTQEVWGTTNRNKHFGLEYVLEKDDKKSIQNSNIIKYKYNRAWPHHGIGMWVEFPEEKGMKKDFYYKEEVNKAMKMLGKDKRTLFIGQTVGYKGSPVYETLDGVAEEKRVELPIMEEVQMGMSTGLSLEGYIPVSIYPRFDFLILATNQLINHLDKTKALSHGQFNPKVIIRTIVGNKEPIDPGPQHYQDHTEVYKLMLTNVDVLRLKYAKDIIPTYKRAVKSDKSSLIIELADLYK